LGAITRNGGFVFFLAEKNQQTANPRAADNFIGFKNLEVIYCNGKDPFNSMNAMFKAKEIDSS
jgi:hypothetical protein